MPKGTRQHLLIHKKVRGHDATPSGLAEALKGAEIVVIPAGVPRKPGMTRDGRQWQQWQTPSPLTASRLVQHQRLHRPRFGQGRC